MTLLARLTGLLFVAILIAVVGVLFTPADPGPSPFPFVETVEAHTSSRPHRHATCRHGWNEAEGRCNCGPGKYYNEEEGRCKSGGGGGGTSDGSEGSCNWPVVPSPCDMVGAPGGGEAGPDYGRGVSGGASGGGGSGGWWSKFGSWWDELWQ